MARPHFTVNQEARMMIVGARRDAEIAALGLGEPVASLARGDSIHRLFDDKCRGLAYSVEPEDFSPTDLDVVPLWEGHSTITGFYHGPDGVVYIHYEVTSIDEFVELGREIDDVLRHLVLLVAENTQDDDELLGLATMLGVRDPQAVVAEFGAEMD